MYKNNLWQRKYHDTIVYRNPNSFINKQHNYCATLQFAVSILFLSGD